MKRAVWIASLLIAATRSANAQTHPPAPHAEEAFDVMNVLDRNGLHDLHDERWNVYGQLTYISSWKRPFNAPYTNLNGSPNSLLPDAERSFTGSLTLYFGVRLWKGAEAYLAPESVMQKALSNLKGLGGSIQNFELQKSGSTTPTLYRSRLFLRQTIHLGGSRVEKTSDPLQLGTVVDSRRLVMTAGNFTILDVFDKNSITSDPRQTFLNMAFMTHSSWDFPADARGYTWGGTVELYWDDWALRFGRIAPPQNPNTLEMDLRLWEHYGDQLEIEHDHKLFGRLGAVRLLAYRNQVVSGRFDDAIAAFRANPERNAAECTAFNYGSQNGTAPDLCWVRRLNTKVGIGVNLEQYVLPDVGVFFRGMISDGETEVIAYNPADRSLNFGALAKGGLWHRPLDVTGVGYGVAWISQAHAEYLGMGGIDAFIGDGRLRKSDESVFEIFYSLNLFRALWLTADFQHIRHPGFNADRGPVTVWGGRFHAEF